MRLQHEHPLRLDDLEFARRWFGSVRATHYHLFALLAMAVHGTPAFAPARQALIALDRWLFRLVPGLQRFAWIVVLELDSPRS
jgi:hypothetical protein